LLKNTKFVLNAGNTVALLVVWMIAVCTIFYCLGAFSMGYMHVGPGDDTVFMGQLGKVVSTSLL
jgi:hypothetical protein